MKNWIDLRAQVHKHVARGLDLIEAGTGYSESLLDLVHSEPRFVDGFYHPIL